jgi:hypothetical protein
MKPIRKEISTMYVDEARIALADLKQSRDSFAQRIKSRGYPIEVTFPGHRFVLENPEDIDQVIAWLETELPLAEEQRRLWREEVEQVRLAKPEISVQADQGHLSQLKMCVASIRLDRAKFIERMKTYPLIFSIGEFEFCVADEIDLDRMYRWICREAERLEQESRHEVYEVICESSSGVRRERKGFLARLFGRREGRLQT